MKNFIEIGNLFIFICFLASVSTENGSKVPSTSRLQMREDRQLFRRSHSRNEFQELRNELRELRNLNHVMNARIDALQGLVAANAQRCPRLAKNARRIGDKCFSIGLIDNTFLDASQFCAQQGGHLAEPLLSTNGLQDFTKSLQQRFPTEFASLLSRNFWINGAVFLRFAGSLVVTETSRGTYIARDSVPFDPASTGNIATLSPSENRLVFVSVTSLHPYVCEFNLV